MERPEFSLSMSYDEFKRHYWYRQELSEICREYGMGSDGTKAELEEKIKNKLSGKSGVSISKRPKVEFTGEIMLETKLLESGFKFNEQTRKFFADLLNMKKFKFNKEMAAMLREAKKRNDYNITVKDLLNTYLESKKQTSEKKILPHYMQTEEQTYQWNNFVREFNEDKRSKEYTNKMKVAAILWSKVRDTPGLKEYSETLMDTYKEEIEKYKITD